ncbi:MAG: SAM-dependent methyltransferase [Candidatus Rickettsia vulgarisii]
MPIYQKIKNLIKQNGYVTIDEMMLQAMSAVSDSYYQRQDHIGEQGDFITAPEISQLFGEIIGLWIIEQWYEIGCPKQTNLVELGPGQGTLMKDLLRVAKLIPEFYQFLQIELLEINPHFIEKQKTNLQEFSGDSYFNFSTTGCPPRESRDPEKDINNVIPKQVRDDNAMLDSCLRGEDIGNENDIESGNDTQEEYAQNYHKLKHISSIKQISKIPSIIIANEFFDALPIKQYIKDSSLWHEKVVIIDNATNEMTFDKINISSHLQNYLQQQHPNANDGAIIEISPQSQDIMRFISEHIKQFNGAAVIIDYGYDIEPKARKNSQYNSTLQAIKDHHYASILETLGETDLSAHVDFYSLKTIEDTKLSSRANVSQRGDLMRLPRELPHNYDLLTQRDFLIKYGILLRSQTLQNKLPEIEAEIINRQVDRLINPNKMGELFKVLQINKVSLE